MSYIRFTRPAYNAVQSVFLPSATKLRRLCFTPVCQSFCSRGGLPQCMLGCNPPGTRHPSPGSRHTPPPDQAPPPEQTHTPGTRHPLTRHPPPPAIRRLLLRTVRILLECILVNMDKTNKSIKQNIFLSFLFFVKYLEVLFHFLAFYSMAQLTIAESSGVQRLDVQTWGVAAERCERLVVGGRTERETRSVCGRCVIRGTSASSSKS